MPTYIALATPLSSGGFLVTIPDFPNCYTKAETLDDARELATELAGLHIADQARAGKRPPRPTSLDGLMKDPANLGRVVVSVWVPDPKAKHERVNVTLPHDLLAEFDRTAKRRGISRSEFLARGGRKELLSE